MTPAGGAHDRPSRTVMPVSSPGSRHSSVPAPAHSTPAPGDEHRLRYQVANLQGLGTCEKQEDSFAFVNALDPEKTDTNGMLAIVCDGMGGMAGGKLASETAVNDIKTDFAGYDLSDDHTRQLCESAVRADAKIHRLLDGKGGSTLVACIIYRNMLCYVSAGDSFLFLVRNGRLFRLNRDQNVLHERYFDAIRRGEINCESIMHDGEDNAVCQYLGCGSLEEIDSFAVPFPLHAGDALMLCSDGVADVLTEDQITACFALQSPEEICASIERAVNAGAVGQYRDNYTALVIRCTY